MDEPPRVCPHDGKTFTSPYAYQKFCTKECKDSWHEAHRYERATTPCKHPDGCPRPARRLGWCAMHYQRVKATGDPGGIEALVVVSYEPGRLCDVDGCADPVDARGYCQVHYQRVRTTGDAGRAEIRGRRLPRGHSSWSASQKHRYYKYGITPEDFDRILASQGDRCYVCRNVDPRKKGNQWSVDHCHDTGVVRFILCHRCNTALGMVGEDPAVAKRLYEVARECQQLRLKLVT